MNSEPPQRPGFEAFDQLATMVMRVRVDGHCLQANAVMEDRMGVSRRTLMRGNLSDWLVDPEPLMDTLRAVTAYEVSAGRFDALLKRTPLSPADALPVHVIVSPSEAAGELLVEMLEIEQKIRLDRQDRMVGQANANKELIRNLAHEIKNPLGGIRGAAQLLAMDLPTRDLLEYTQIIIQEADRLQSLVDRLLAPHRRPVQVRDVNIHEVCEHVRALILAEFRSGLVIDRDYDASIPEFRGDPEHLIQAVLNIVRNAAQALGEAIAAGHGRIMLRTRVARQVTVGRQRFRLALELHIEDNGPGIPEPIRDLIFQPLVSGREGGSGLGLTLAQTFVQQHQGTIVCDSRPGRTVFTLTIPLP